MVAALLASLILVLVFTPVMAGWFLKPTSRITRLEEAEQAGEVRVMRKLASIYAIPGALALGRRSL